MGSCVNSLQLLCAQGGSRGKRWPRGRLLWGEGPKAPAVGLGCPSALWLGRAKGARGLLRARVLGPCGPGVRSVPRGESCLTPAGPPFDPMLEDRGLLLLGAGAATNPTACL